MSEVWTREQWCKGFVGHPESNERDTRGINGETVWGIRVKRVQGIAWAFRNKIHTALGSPHFHADYCLTRPVRRSCRMFLAMPVITR